MPPDQIRAGVKYSACPRIPSTAWPPIPETCAPSMRVYEIKITFPPQTAFATDRKHRQGRNAFLPDFFHALAKRFWPGPLR